ncbi:hypothetical protein [Mesorhizobium silamurunense]|uniref:hypothetical protein n=1 Tax=Mesorhizobium silamurunense TaxID=499528 RepID=UPI00177F7556|nr:hypothetical protein [Mesorhizobium silamurunense]
MRGHAATDKPTRAALLEAVFNIQKWDNPLLLDGIKLNTKAGSDVFPSKPCSSTSSTARNMFRLGSFWISKARLKSNNRPEQDRYERSFTYWWEGSAAERLADDPEALRNRPE